MKKNVYLIILALNSVVFATEKQEVKREYDDITRQRVLMLGSKDPLGGAVIGMMNLFNPNKRRTNSYINKGHSKSLSCVSLSSTLNDGILEPTSVKRTSSLPIPIPGARMPQHTSLTPTRLPSEDNSPRKSQSKDNSPQVHSQPLSCIPLSPFINDQEESSNSGYKSPYDINTTEHDEDLS